MTLPVQSIMMFVRAKKEGDEVSPLSKGTKLTDNPRNVRLEIRLTQSENKMLEECAERLNATKTNVILKGIEMVSNEIKK